MEHLSKHPVANPMELLSKHPLANPMELLSKHPLANPIELLSEHKQSSKLVALTPLIGISVIGDHPKNGMETHHDWLTLFRKEPPSSGGELLRSIPISQL
jgi:hypothetical protein